MGSATTEAITAARRALDALAGKDSLALGEQLLQVARVIGGSAQLRSALSEASDGAGPKTELIDAVFPTTTPEVRALVAGMVSSQWSTQDDLLAGLEEIGIRAIAASAGSGVSVEQELFSFGTAVASDPELELAVGSKLGSAESKSQLIRTLLSAKASPQTLAIVDHLVQQPRGRRIGELVKTATTIVADAAGRSVATVTSAVPLQAAQLDRLRAGLEATYGRPLQLNQVINPDLIGGLRVQVGDDVIDGSVATRINDLRLQLAS
jgi:F-type H+-transporting ATPase subunit delta